MKLRINFNKEKKKINNLQFVKNYGENAFFFFNYLVASQDLIVHGDNSTYYYMENCYFNKYNHKDMSKRFEKELNHPYDQITESDNLQRFLLSPYKMDRRYQNITYDEIKRKGFIVVSRRIKGCGRMFKHQRVAYFLHHRRRVFPRNSMIVHSLPPDITLRLDTKCNKIRLEGPNCNSVWQHFNI